MPPDSPPHPVYREEAQVGRELQVGVDVNEAVSTDEVNAKVIDGASSAAVSTLLTFPGPVSTSIKGCGIIAIPASLGPRV